MNEKIKIGDWVLCPLTKDDEDNPNIVAKVVSVVDNIINIQLYDGTVPMPKTYCRIVYVQMKKNEDINL